MSKVWTLDIAMVNGNKYYTIDNWSSYSDYNIPDWLVSLNNSTIYKWTATFSVTLIWSWESPSSSFRPILKYWDKQATTDTARTASFDVNNFDSSIPYQCQYYHTWTTSSRNELTQITLHYNDKKWQNAKKTKVFTVKWLWEIVDCYLFWRLPNWEWWDWN